MYSVHRVEIKLLQIVLAFVYYTRGCGVDVNILFLASVGSRRELSMHLLKVQKCTIHTYT